MLQNKLKIAKQQKTTLYCDSCGKELKENEFFATSNGCECEKCKDNTLAEFTHWQNLDTRTICEKTKDKLQIKL